MNNPDRDSKALLGTFGGVFTPSILTILGIILFLRLGFVVGQAGLAQTLLIILMAYVISVLTSLSLSAVATNMRVKGGGYYYLISRTLGLEFGGAIGLVLFLAQSVSIGFYLIGFGEALSWLLPQSIWFSPQILALAAGAPLLLLAWLGADWATRFQYLVMGVLALALTSFFVGGLFQWKWSVLAGNWSAPEQAQGFWVVFAVFFPAVTGFTQGVNMSGDLKDPGRSLPLGTFAAVGISLLVYLGCALVLGGSLPGEVLRSDFAAMQQVALGQWLVLAGVIAATLSSAMASFLGAPRILQALAADRIVPVLKPFAQGAGPMNNPRRGVMLSAAIALATIGIGRLNAIAPLVTMFFLISYGLLNYATYFEARSQSPSFRPSFRFFDKRLSLAGMLSCLGVMLSIHPAAAVAAVSVLFAIYHYLKRTSGPAGWADSQRSYHLQQIRSHLLGAAQESEHPRHWRPQILAFSDEPERRLRLLETAKWLEGGSGLTTLVRIMEGQGLKTLRASQKAQEELRKAIQTHESSAFPLCLAAPDLRTGIHVLLQSYGIGPLQANTVLLNWFKQAGHAGRISSELATNLRTVFHLRRNILLLDAGKHKWDRLESSEPQRRRIDIWWWGDATSRLMLLLGYLMTKSPFWEEARLNVLGVEGKISGSGNDSDLEEVLNNYRVEAESSWIQAEDASAVAEQSAEAALVFLPFALKRSQLRDPFGGDLDWLLPRLPVTLLCLAAEDLDLDAEPEEGPAAEAAGMHSQVEEMSARSKKSTEESRQAEEKTRVLEQELTAAKRSGAAEEEWAEMQDALHKMRAETSKLQKKAARDQAKLEEARQKAQEFGVENTEVEK